MVWENILVSKDSEGILTIKINRPDKMNAMNVKTAGEICAVMTEAEYDSTAKVVVVTGAGRAFCAGGDIDEMPRDCTPDVVHEWIEPSRKLALQALNMAKPIICAVNGYALGAGFSLALLGDLIIASEKARFGPVFINVALTPDTGTAYLLPRMVGLRKAKELAFSGEIIDAREAEQIGLVNKVVSAETFEEEVERLARKIAKGPTWAIGLTKKLLNKSYETDLPSLLELEIHCLAQVMMSEDFKEGVNAFLEKREAKFKGR